MRRIIASEFVSADGYIEGPKGDMTWVTGSFNDEMGKYAGGSYGVHGHGYVGKGDLSADGHCLAELDRARVGWMNNSPKVVLSKTLRKAPWGGYEPARIISDGVEGEMRELKEKSGKNIVIYGSANAVQSLTRMGVIDEYHLLVHPVFLGAGKRLFEGMQQPTTLKLHRTQTYRNGVNVLYYERH